MEPIQNYIANLPSESDQAIGQQLTELIEAHLAFTESKIWHAHPVWFIDGNPIVGFSKQKAGIRLLFWSGADFEEPALNVRGQKFKDASIFYNSVSEINAEDVQRWLKNQKLFSGIIRILVKRKGELVRLYVAKG
jgi:hypothetical protein